MKKAFNLEKYLTNGVEHIIKRAAQSALSNKAAFAFITKLAVRAKQAAKIRKAAAENGEHIPPFLIASITSTCNLHCSGCYARANHACNDDAPTCQLTAEEWARIFTEAGELGILFILLAGGEPLMRRDVIEAAAAMPAIVFPVFTNGTMLQDDYMALFKKSRNLIPVLSIEGNREKTDARRGNGMYQTLLSVMEEMHKSDLFFGASITASADNLASITAEEYVRDLKNRGCRLFIYVEYVPISADTATLALDDAQRLLLRQRLDAIRSQETDILLVSFPGDEGAAGGCLAAGRGFFHINSHGGAEPCPFSPYSDINLKNASVKEALHSRLFEQLQNDEILSEAHIGGCVLFQNKAKVEQIIHHS